MTVTEIVEYAVVDSDEIRWNILENIQWER